MPELVWFYLTALLYYRTSGSCVALAETLETVSHDRLTRMLQGDWSGHTLLDLVVRTLFVCKRGYLILDDTVIPKPFATAMEGLAWVFSILSRAVGLDEWDASQSSRHPALAQGGAFKVCAGIGVIELCP